MSLSLFDGDGDSTRRRVQHKKNFRRYDYYELNKILRNDVVSPENLSLKHYVSDGYYEINSALRSGVILPEIQEHINNINKIIDIEGKEDKDVVLFKFTDYQEYLKLNVGDVFIDRGFFSQTSNEESAIDGGKAMGILLRVYWEKLPKSLRLRDECEVLTYPGVKLTVEKIKDKPKYRLICCVAEPL